MFDVEWWQEYFFNFLGERNIQETFSLQILKPSLSNIRQVRAYIYCSSFPYEAFFYSDVIRFDEKSRSLFQSFTLMAGLD